MSYRILIDEPRPWREVLRFLLVILLIIAAFLGGYYLGQTRGKLSGGLVSEDKARRLAVGDMLQGQIEQLEDRNRELLAAAEVAKQAEQVSDEAVDGVRAELETLRSELQQTQKLLEFYTGIVSPADARGGLRLHQFTMRPVTDRNYSFRLMLVQTKNHSKVQVGKVSMDIYGVLSSSGSPLALSLADVSYPPRSTIDYGFRYFQEFTGDVALPIDFVPTRLKLTVKPSRGGNTLERTYDWSTFDGVETF